MFDELPSTIRRVDERAARRRTAVLSRLLRGVLVASTLALFLTPAVFADSIAERKAAREVGEQLDGYVGIAIENPSPELQALVSDINRRRREGYQSIAAERQIDTAQVAARAGEKLVERTSPGHLVKDKQGHWRPNE